MGIAVARMPRSAASILGVLGGAAEASGGQLVETSIRTRLHDKCCRVSLT
ncbi:MAG: hypothetical protein USCGTAYLOR_01597 [Chromatiales bacterium USCg_Taylor]|nr:MAG: hypothetical protein USCGTAYLOR_01597 [Chromatiales bacterium USCg_Taylor]